MRNLFVAVSLMFPVVATAQAEAVHAAVSVPPDWNVGAGITFGAGIASGALLSGGGLLGGLGTSLGVSAQPRMTVLIERRLSDRLFLGFGAGVSFSSTQTDTSPELRQVSFDGTIGLRRLFNPRGVVEVSWFANVGVSYANVENRSRGVSIDPVTGMLNQNTPQVLLAQGFGIGAATGLTLERELISGLALRLSSSVVGIGYRANSSRLTVGEESRESSGNTFDGGLRFSPTIELRYAF